MRVVLRNLSGSDNQCHLGSMHSTYTRIPDLHKCSFQELRLARPDLRISTTLLFFSRSLVDICCSSSCCTCSVRSFYLNAISVFSLHSCSFVTSQPKISFASMLHLISLAYFCVLVSRAFACNQADIHNIPPCAVLTYLLLQRTFALTPEIIAKRGH